MPDGEEMLCIGTDVAPELVPLVSKTLERTRTVDQPVPAFPAGLAALFELDSAERQAWAEFDGVDVTLNDALRGLGEMMPRVVDHLAEVDAEAGRGFAALGDGGG